MDIKKYKKIIFCARMNFNISEKYKNAYGIYALNCLVQKKCIWSKAHSHYLFLNYHIYPIDRRPSIRLCNVLIISYILCYKLVSFVLKK